MAEVFPFAGTRYNFKVQNIDMGKVICPPYDVIDGPLLDELYERHPHNMVRLTSGRILPADDETNNRYLRSAELYKDWKASEIFLDEQRKCFYVYEHEFALPGSKKTYTRRGFFSRVKLQDFRSGKIRSHEMTFAGPKLDRLNLLRTTQVNFDPIFALYKDPDWNVDAILKEIIKKGKPEMEFKDLNGHTHRLWLLHRKDPVLRIHEEMKPKRLYLADGHHRYEAALLHRDEMRELTGHRDGRRPFDFSLMFLANADDETLFTKPTHRVLAREMGLDVEIDEVMEDLEEFFDVKKFKLDLKNIDKASQKAAEMLEPPKKGAPRFVMVLPSGPAFQLTLKSDVDVEDMIEDMHMSEMAKNLDVVLLHRYVIAQGWIGNPEVELHEDDIHYTQEIPKALDLIHRRKGCVAFLMNPIGKEEALAIAESGELMPLNSTYFYPKLHSGFVMRDLGVGYA